MIVLMISRDEDILRAGAAAAERMKEYGALAEAVHIVVFSRQQLSGGKKIGDNAWVYSTNSRSKWRYAFDARIVAMRIIRERGLDRKQTLIIAQDPFEAGLAGRCVARKFRIPLQLQIHTDLFSPYFKRESVINMIRVRMAGFLIPHAACIRAVSERIRRSIAAPVTLSVLPIFVDTQKIHDAPIKTDLHKKYPQLNFIALMASRFTREKNIPMAISAMAEVVRVHPQAGLIIVGVGPEKAAYETMISRLRLKKNVVLEEWTDDLASYYKTADVFVLSSNYEGYGRTAIEAEAAGCPVIMTDVGIAGDIIKHGENGLIVPVRGVQALAEAICSMIEKKVAVRASLPAQQTKEEYMRAYKKTWEQCAS